jgi:vacuolar-type H+-ATPase subunit F/Vma7
MYKIKAIGSNAFLIGFQLTGIETIECEEEPMKAVEEALKDESCGIIITDETTMNLLPEYFRADVEAKVKPVTVVLSTKETSNETLRNKIKKAIGVDLWK